MSDFLNRIAKLSPQRLALLADELNERVQAAERSRRVPLAIVGIGCRLPGGVRDPDEFWNLLSDGTDAIGEVPPSRWDIEQFYDRNPDTPGKMATRWGGFIDGPDQFDPQFFGIAPAEATGMDPQQRLLLETAWEALEHAGIAPSSLAGTKTGVFVGICSGDYTQIALESSRERLAPYLASGLSHAVAAGRISYILGLQGPSMAVDTSCSASLVAVHLACQSLRLGESNAAIAAGVNLILRPDITIALSQSRMMAPDGRCKTFSNSANGFVRGEGCGVVVLKRLPDALRDRNRILAVIRGSACNQDGRSSGLTAPNGPSQEAVISAALSDAGLRPADVDYIEAHGTGTALGDPIEIGALNAVFAGRSAEPEPLFVGSVKTNLGHLEPAAGIAGLIKLVLSIQHGQIPASLHFDTPNSRMEWEWLPIEVPTALQPWKRRGEKRIGGVSSFGFSGTNAHVVVEEFVGENPRQQRSLANGADRALLFPFSAKTNSALKAMTVRLHHCLKEHPSLRLADVAHTLNSGRSRFEHRAAFTTASHAELLDLLSSVVSDTGNPAIQTGRAKPHSPRVAFVFVGGPGDFRRELYEQAPSFHAAIDSCAKILSGGLDQPLTALLYPAPGDRRGLRTARDQAAAEFALQYALAELWRACGVEPHAVLGRGAGEFAAACVAGIFTLEDGLRLAIASGGNNAAELEQCVRRIAFQAPRLLLVPNRNDAALEVSSPEYWLRRSETLTPLASSSLAKESCAANLILGGNKALKEFLPSAGKSLPGKLLFSGPGDCRDFLHAAGALFVLGCDVNTDALYRDETTTAVALPTYPFERERYWIEERASTSQAAPDKSLSHAQTNSAADPEGWIYDLVWEPKPLPRGATAPFDERLIETLPTRSADGGLVHYDDLNARLDPVCTAFIADALHQLGADSLTDHVLSVDEICQRLNIAAPRRRLFERLLAVLVEDGLVERIGEEFRLSSLVNARKSYPAAATELPKLQSEHPLRHIEMNVLARCGENLAAVLVGKTDPVHLLFPNNSTEETEHIYRNSPMARYYNELIADGVQAAVESASGRMVRILEIGAGIGATTQSVLPRIAGKQFGYTFTDISPAFLARARGKFADYPALDCRVLNIENDPAAQGFEQSAYDIVIAANVLHATADLRHTLAHIQKLLAPGGLVLLLEAMRPERAVDLTFGLTEGWWRFADTDIRPDHPLIAADTWTRLLQEVGMASTRVMACAAHAYQKLIVAQAPATEQATPKPLNTPGRRYILLVDDSGIGAALHTLLTDAGESCETIHRSGSNGAALSQLSEFLSRAGTAPVEIVYLWGTDVSDPAGSLAMLSAGEELCVRTPAHIIQAMLRQPTSHAHLWLITRGAQATRSFSPSACGAAQSMMWGVGRSFGLEDLERYRGLIDLAPGESSHQAAQTIFTELRAEDTEDQIAYRDGHRLAARLKSSSLEKSTPSPLSRPRKDGAYLITGGLGGIGLRVSKWAAAQGAGHLVLLGRTGTGANAGPFAAERLQTVREIRELGADVTLVEADVASAADMKQLFQRFGGELPPLRGVFHVATIWGGVRLANVTDQQIERMLRPKVLGTWRLHEWTKNLELDFFLTFSSAASLLGAKGMAHYAAANQFLDAFAHFRRAAGLPMLSVNWGAWDAMRLIPLEEQTRMGEAGVTPMPSEKVLSLFGDLIASKRAQVMIAGMDWDVSRAHLGIHRDWPLLENLGDAHRKHRNAARPSPVAPADLRRAIGMPPLDRGKFIENYVQEQAARVLGLRRGELPPADVPLTDLGLDSLMAVDLKNHLQSGLGRELSPTIVFDFPTVADIAAMLDTMLWAAHSGAEDDIASVQKDEICI